MREPQETAALTPIWERENHDEIAALAYTLWIERGYPAGSPDEDWFHAERELKKRGRLPYALREMPDPALD